MTCYLCGLALSGAQDRDHVPPQQFFAPSIRQAANLSRLVTLPTHRECNGAYKLDEEYFTHTLSPLALESPTAAVLVAYNFAKARQGRAVGLNKQLFDSLDPRPSGLFLPKDRVLLRCDGARISRVVWKIVRELYFVEHGVPLPEPTIHTVEVREPENEERSSLDDLWNAVRAEVSRGDYQRVFAYKYLRASSDETALHGWAMLLWDRVIIYCGHHDALLPP